MKTLSSITLSLALTLAVAPTLVWGFDGNARAAVRSLFDGADRDQSGVLSEQEYLEANLDRYGVAFEVADADGDGGTTLAEYVALFERHHPTGQKSRL